VQQDDVVHEAQRSLVGFHIRTTVTQEPDVMFSELRTKRAGGNGALPAIPIEGGEALDHALDGRVGQVHEEAG
jgi:hypothetical protein